MTGDQDDDQESREATGVGPIQVRRLRPLGWRAKFRVTRPGCDPEEVRLRGLTRRGTEHKAQRARDDVAEGGQEVGDPDSA